MALDLSALEEKPTATAAVALAQPTGKPLEISLSDIEEDPDQPRKEFTPEAMTEMADSIRERGVKTPVSVRSHPSKPGMWMLNYGARRYRGSAAAGRETIPAFVDESHDDYDQVIENIQRDDLKPMELALFIQKRLDAGDKKSAIAKNLGKDGAVITQHLALIDLPACIEDVYSSGLCTSPKTLYELRSLHNQFPKEVDAWCADQIEVTRKGVSELADELKGKKKPVPLASESESQNESESDKAREKNDHAENDHAGAEFGHDQGLACLRDEADTNETDTEEGDPTVSKLPFHNPDIEKDDKGPTITDPNKLKKPLLLVEFDGREAMILLNRRPTTPGLIHIRFEDGSGDQEVDAAACKINMLTDSEK